MARRRWWLAAAGAADPPDRINYQGVLRTDEGLPVDGAVSMAFSFFDAATGEQLHFIFPSDGHDRDHFELARRMRLPVLK